MCRSPKYHTLRGPPQRDPWPCSGISTPQVGGHPEVGLSDVPHRLSCWLPRTTRPPLLSCHHRRLDILCLTTVRPGRAPQAWPQTVAVLPSANALLPPGPGSALPPSPSLYGSCCPRQAGGGGASQCTPHSVNTCPPSSPLPLRTQMGSEGQGSPLAQVGWRGRLQGPGVPVRMGPPGGRWDCLQRRGWIQTADGGCSPPTTCKPPGCPRGHPIGWRCQYPDGLPPGHVWEGGWEEEGCSTCPPLLVLSPTKEGGGAGGALS